MSSIIRWYPSVSEFWLLYHAIAGSPQWREVYNYYIRVPGINFYNHPNPVIGNVGNAAVNLLYMYGLDVYSYDGDYIIDHHLVDDDLFIFWRDIMRGGFVASLDRYSWRVRNNPLFMQLPTNPLGFALGYSATYCAATA